MAAPCLSSRVRLCVVAFVLSVFLCLTVSVGAGTTVKRPNYYESSMSSHAERSFLNCAETCPCPQPPPPCPPRSPCPRQEHPLSAQQSMLKIVSSAYTTLETLLRAFSLGFGARLLKFWLYDHDEDLSQVRDRMIKSAVAGLSMSCFILGMGMFLPARYRMKWFEIEWAILSGRWWQQLNNKLFDQ